MRAVQNNSCYQLPVFACVVPLCAPVALTAVLTVYIGKSAERISYYLWVPTLVLNRK